MKINKSEVSGNELKIMQKIESRIYLVVIVLFPNIFY